LLFFARLVVRCVSRAFAYLERLHFVARAVPCNVAFAVGGSFVAQATDFAALPGIQSSAIVQFR
jgi:hypothetical protein